MAIYIHIYIYIAREKTKEKGLVMKKPHEVGALMEMKSQMSLQIGSKINVQVNRCEGERTHEDAIQSQQRKCCKSGGSLGL